MIIFTKDIERFKANPNKRFEIVIGQVKGTWGLSLKIVITDKEVKHAMDLVSEKNGKIYAGLYKDRRFYTVAFRNNLVDKKWHFYKLNRLDLRVPVKENNEKRD